MRLPLPLLESPLFQFERLSDLERAIGDFGNEEEIGEIRRLLMLGLPPIASAKTLAVLLGVNPGLVWSFENRPQRHYRQFSVPKGRSERIIHAPRVALKIPQKWIGVHLARKYAAPDHVFGFVPNRSHINAAKVHLGARWVLSIDIEDFFPSTSQGLVLDTLRQLGYRDEGAKLVAALSCYRGGLAQGAPCSPIISNFCFAPWDERLRQLAAEVGVRLSRYADDIVLSGTSDYPLGLKERVVDLVQASPWRISPDKTSFAIAPARRKVHGLLVSGDKVRLTKGYRNKLRALRHVLNVANSIDPVFARRVRGHITYSEFVERD